MPQKPYAASVSGILEGCWKALENLEKISARLCKCNKKHVQNLSFQTRFLLKLAERKGFEPLCGLTRKLISSLLVSVSTSGRFVPVSGRFVWAKSRIK